ncbi:MAG: MBL fold metallo-hydrolase, partial [Elusimicrobiaceae bacterium]|nr:MBL fold metallo-hydrolase [Elusimicrobiaceae bacterium]
VDLSGLAPDVLHTYHGDQQLQIGPFQVTILVTPGHTAGSVCIQIENNLFTGDTLFPGACGRVDLPTSSPRAMAQSLKRIATLPKDTVVYAGHSYGGRCRSTISEEKLNTPFMRNALRGESI